MISTLFFCASFTSLFLSLFLLPKHKEKLNGVKQIIITFVTIMCIMSIPVLIFKMLSIPVNLNSLGVAILMISIVFWSVIIRLGNVQRFFLSRYDLILVIFWSICFWGLFLHIFTPDLKLCYMNSDIGNHFNMAMDVVNRETVNIMFTTEVFNSVIIRLAMPFLDELYYYKAFIIGDAILNWLPLLFFYVLISDYLDRKSIKVLAPTIGVLYFCGYPVYSYLCGGFVYWGVGTMLIGYVVYLMKIYLKEKENRFWIELLMLLACCTIGVTYTLFLPMTFAAVFGVLIISIISERMKLEKKTILTYVVVFLIPCIAILCLVYVIQSGNINSIIEAVSVDGGIYSNLYMDFVFFIPLIIYAIVVSIKKKEINVEQIFLFVFLLFTVIMLGACMLGILSRYYYYKMYYPLWVLFWIVSIQGISLLLKEKNIMCMSYLGMLVVVAFIQFSGIEDKIRGRVPEIQIEEANAKLFYIYHYNYPFMRDPFPQRDDSKLELYNYVLDELYEPGEKVRNVPVITSRDYWIDSIWYDGITGHKSKKYYTWTVDLKYIENRLMEKSDYFVVFKESDFYINNYDFLSQYTQIYEDENGIVYQVNN